MSKEYADLSVLVIDDDSHIVRIVEHVLREMGFKDVMSTLFPKTGLSLILDGSAMGKGFDLVICDWMMPEMTGIELLKQVRAKELKLPFIMLTAKATEDAVIEAKGLDVDAYLAKPFSADQIQRKVSTLITRAKRPD